MPIKRTVRAGAWCVTLGAITGLIGCSAGDQGPAAESREPVDTDSVRQAVTQLKAVHPNAHARVQGSRVRRVYGVVATGSSPDNAAERFRQGSAAAFGVAPGDLAPAKGRHGARPHHQARKIKPARIDQGAGKADRLARRRQGVRHGIPEEQLQDQRQVAKDLDIDRAQKARCRVAARPHQPDDQTQHRCADKPDHPHEQRVH
ncbi:MAG TPA: hypothetical protein PLU22_24570, partial [Polyangiaceae bacterium]|nr:hypothetical protein [Polyangiaceae bacterium]